MKYIKHFFAEQTYNRKRSTEALRIEQTYLKAEHEFYGKLKVLSPELATEYESVRILSSELAYEDTADRFTEGFSAGLSVGMEAAGEF